jgi:hypothetical protein
LLTNPAWLHADSAGSRRLVDHDLTGGQRLAAGCTRPSIGTWVAAGCASGGSELGLEVGVSAGLAYQQRGQAKAKAGVGQAEEERLGAQPGPGGDEPGEVGGEGDRQVAGGLVQAHRQATAARAGQVDLHDHRGRPAQPLVDPEQHVGGHHPAPGGRPDEQQRHRKADQPAGHQHRFAAVAVGEGAGQEVGDRLGQPECDDVGERGGDRGQPEDLGGEQRQQAALLADHATDQRVDADQQAELGQVGPQAEPQSA